MQPKNILLEDIFKKPPEQFLIKINDLKMHFKYEYSGGATWGQWDPPTRKKIYYI